MTDETKTNTETKTPAFFVPYSEFAAKATELGYKPDQYSGSGYYVKTKNGVRVELQNTRGGVFGIGYTNQARVVDFLDDHFKANPPEGLTFISRIKGSFNYKATNLDDFFRLVGLIEAVAIPAARPVVEKPVKEEKKEESKEVAPAATKKEPIKPIHKVAEKAKVGTNLTAEELADIKNGAAKRAPAKHKVA